MSDIGLALNAGQLPYSCYPSDPQTLINDAFRLGSALMPTIKGVVIGDSSPPTSDQDKLWIKTSSGAPIGQFIFFNAKWVWPHAAPAGGSERRMWVGTIADLITYDGGDVNALGPASGAMWEVDANFDNRIPIGAGATAALNTNAGATTYTLIGTDIPAHTHTIGVDGTGNATDGLVGELRAAATNVDFLPATPANSLGVTRPNQTAAATAFSILNPVRGLYLIKRSSRVYIAG